MQTGWGGQQKPESAHPSCSPITPGHWAKRSSEVLVVSARPRSSRLTLGRQQSGDVLQVAIAARLPLQADQVVEPHRANADPLDDGLDGAGAHLLVRAATGNLGWIEEVEPSRHGAQGEVAAVEEILGIVRVDLVEVGVDSEELGIEVAERRGQAPHVLGAPLDLSL